MRATVLLYLDTRSRRAPRLDVDIFEPGAVAHAVEHELKTALEEHAPRRIYAQLNGKGRLRLVLRQPTGTPVVFVKEHTSYEQRAHAKRIGIVAIDCVCTYCDARAKRLAHERQVREGRAARKLELQRLLAARPRPQEQTCPRCGCTPARPCNVKLAEDKGTACCVPAGRLGMKTCSACAPP